MLTSHSVCVGYRVWDLGIEPLHPVLKVIRRLSRQCSGSIFSVPQGCVQQCPGRIPKVPPTLCFVQDKWPGCLIQFEDFATDKAFAILDRMQDKYLCFNDDIQGTGAVVTSG